MAKRRRGFRRGELGFMTCDKTKLHPDGELYEGRSVTDKADEKELFGRVIDGKYVPPKGNGECPICGGSLGYSSKATNQAFARAFHI